jgi:endonuclease/exonuclease/phosphatase (EEP) superfamily protein YafD
LFSRHPYINGGSIERTDSNPGVVWAHIRQENISYEFIGVHFAYPFHARAQARHFDWLIHYIRTRARPLIVAGDFNLTPFSAKLTKFAFATGLKRHATLLATWPGDKFRPVFLIDHVFSSREFYSVNVTVGPFLGSDHRPVIADIGLRSVISDQ